GGWVHPNLGDDRGKTPRLGEECDACQRDGGSQDITLAIYDRTAKRRIEIITLGQLPTEEFPRLIFTGLRGIRGRVTAFTHFLYEYPLNQGVFKFIGIAQDVTLVKANNILEI